MRVRYLLSHVLLFCFVCLSVSNAQSGSFERSVVKQTNTPKQQSPLQLTLKILRQTYCLGDSELDGLRLDVSLTYTNIGKQRLILYKGSNLVSQIMVSRNIEDAEARRFELNSSLTQITTQADFNDFKRSVPSKYFVILPPGASYKVQAVVGLFAVRGDVRAVAGAVLSGKHVLQVEVPTWPESNELAEELRHHWRRSGFLWYEPITSLPVPFTVGKQRRLVDCP